MAYILYNRPGSDGVAVEAALTLADAPFELAELGSKAGTPLPDSFRETNPWGQVPTLILPNGTTMTETSAILVHFGLCFPDEHLAPPPGTSAHGAFLRWTTFANVNLYEAVVRRGYPFRFTDDLEGYDALRRDPPHAQGARPQCEPQPTIGRINLHERMGVGRKTPGIEDDEAEAASGRNPPLCIRRQAAPGAVRTQHRHHGGSTAPIGLSHAPGRRLASRRSSPTSAFARKQPPTR